MSKKRAKSGAGSAGMARWEQALMQAQFIEETWNASIIFLVGDNLHDYSHLDVLAGVVQSGIRRLFSVISKDELFEEVRDLGGKGGGKKTKETPAHMEICESVKSYIDNDEEIPLPLLAKLMKFKLLWVKSNDLKRREAEKKNAADREKAAKGGGKERSKSPAKGKGGKKTPEPPSAKVGSKLRKRGEEDLDSKYIDDEPDDGPQHYIFVYGFNHPHLPVFMSDLGLNIDAIVKIQSEDYSRYATPPPTPLPEGEVPPEKDEKTLALEEEALQKKLKKLKELKKFWRDILPIMQNQPHNSKLHDVARLEYTVKEDIIPDNLEDNEKKTNFGTLLFEDLACMAYDLLDAKRLYQTYLTNMNLLRIPVYGEAPPAQPPPEGGAPPAAPTPTPQGGAPAAQPPEGAPSGAPVPQEVDMRYYNDLMNSVPQESVSVPLIMHCMLEQIQATETEKEPPSETPLPTRPDGLDNQLAAHISGIAFKLSLSKEEQQLLADEFEEPEKKPEVFKGPLLLNHSDHLSERTHHLRSINGFNPKEAELDMLQYLPFAKLANFEQPSNKVAKERAARLQELIHFCATEGLTPSEIDRAFKQFVFECMDLIETEETGMVGAVPLFHTAVPWDDPYPFFKGMIPMGEKVEEKIEALKEALSENSLEDEINSDVLEPELLPSSYDVDGILSPYPRPLSPTPNTLDLDFTRATSQQKVNQTNSRPQSASSSQAGSGQGSRPTTPGILKKSDKPGSATSARSAHSVHFERDESGNPIPSRPIALKDEIEEQISKEEPTKTPEESMDEVVDAQKRQLDSWCFAEHFEPHVLLQVLQEASYSLPYVDTYYHKRDHSLMVVLHNPQNREMQNHTTWSVKLHANVGFRNYLEHVAPDIEDWLKEEEAAYQANLLADEVEKLRLQDAAAATPSSTKKGRAKSPRAKSPRARSKSPRGSRGSSTERPDSAQSNPFIRAGSLKAQKEEMDRLRQEAEELERQKNEKRIKSAQKKADAAAAKEKEKEAEKKKRPRSGSRGSARSRKSKEDVVSPAPPEDELKDAGKHWPFTGYDVCNDLIHATGTVSNLFPADGGLIRTERVDYVQGQTSVKTSVVKDGHLFTIHLLDPKEKEAEKDDLEESKDGREKAEFEKSEKEETGSQSGEMSGDEVGKEGAPSPRAEEPLKKPSVAYFGSFSAEMQDGMYLSFSVYGGNGVPAGPDGQKPQPDPYVAPPPRSPSPAQASPAKGKGKDKGKGAQDKAAATPEPTIQDEEPKDDIKIEEELVPEQPFQELFVSCPDGLSIQYMLESHCGVIPADENDRKVIVKQSYPFKTNGKQDCEAKRKVPAMQEASRLVTCEGNIIRFFQDDSLQILYADGTVSNITGNFVPLPPSRMSSPSRINSAKSQADKDEKEKEKEKPSSPKKGGKQRKSAQLAEKQPDNLAVEESEPKGECITTMPSGERISVKPDGKSTPLPAALFTYATDPESKQMLTTREDHVMIVQHPDGKRIVQHSDGTRITTYYVQEEMYQHSADTGEDVKMETPLVQMFKVECPGYATLDYNTATGCWKTEFGTGSVIHTTPNGCYTISHQDGGNLVVDEEGSAVYNPKPDNNIEFASVNQKLVYAMRHHADVICETVDNEGNIFNVKHNGDTIVMSPSGSELEVEVEDKEVENAFIEKKEIILYKQHAPRFFIIHGNGSGTEILRYQDIADYIAAAETDKSTAIIKEPLPDYPGVTGITILRPYKGGPSDWWFKNYEENNIIPSGLRSRDLKTLPSKEFKKPGPKFGTNVGQGLAIGSAVPPKPKYELLKCPSVLELRQFVQYKPVSAQLREKLGDGLREYAEFVRERNLHTADLLVKDPRTPTEQNQAAELSAIVSPRLQKMQIKEIEANVEKLYQDATAPPVPSPPPTPRPKRTAADWERDRRELAEEIDGRNALRKKSIPPYFQSEFGKAFLLSQAPDMEAMTRQLSEDPRHDGHQAVRSASSTPAVEERSSAPPPYKQSDGSQSSSSPGMQNTQQRTTAAYDSPSPAGPAFIATDSMQSNLRPGNPTPAHATGQGSPSPLRPKNPTPLHSTQTVPDRPGNPTPKQTGDAQPMPSETPSSYWSPTCHPSIPEQPIQEEAYDEIGAPSAESQIVLTRSLQVDVIGEDRKEPVHVPAYIRGGRPGGLSNQKFRTIEDPVRRRVHTSSVAGATLKGKSQLEGLRGFELLPDKVDFGMLREGYTYSFTVFLKNTGVDSCRYKVRQPPPSTGLKVLYMPGLIAAGMKAELRLELYAIAVGVEGESGIGTVAHNLEIITETDQLFLPVAATVMTGYDYDQSGLSKTTGPGVLLVATHPPAGQGIIRPRRDHIVESPR